MLLVKSGSFVTSKNANSKNQEVGGLGISRNAIKRFTKLLPNLFLAFTFFVTNLPITMIGSNASQSPSKPEFTENNYTSPVFSHPEPRTIEDAEANQFQALAAEPQSELRFQPSETGSVTNCYFWCAPWISVPYLPEHQGRVFGIVYEVTGEVGGNPHLPVWNWNSRQASDYHFIMGGDAANPYVGQKIAIYLLELSARWYRPICCSRDAPK